MKEPREIAGIKFYDTQEMGIVCSIADINTAIAGKSNRGSFRRSMLNYQHIKDAFPNLEERNKQIQYLEYSGMRRKLFISLRLILVHLEESEPKKNKEENDRVLREIKENFTLESTSHLTYQEETTEEPCEIAGIKFYNTQEMGIACLLSEINKAITGQSSGGFKRQMLDYEHIKDVFKEPDIRNKQIQKLGTDERIFVSLDLVYAHLKRTKPGRYKERYNTILQGIEEKFPQLKDIASDPNIISDPDTTLDFGTTPKQELLPIPEAEYSFLYIAKAGITDTSSGNITNPLDIHFGITAGDPKDRIKTITSGSYRAQLVATIAFRGIKHRNDGSKIACEECAALETWFKNNPEWVNIQGSDESFRYEDPWKELLREIEASEKTGPPLYALYPDDPVIMELVPPHLISKIHNLGETREMMEIARFAKGNVIATGELKAFFEDEWIIVHGLIPTKKR